MNISISSISSVSLLFILLPSYISSLFSSSSSYSLLLLSYILSSSYISLSPLHILSFYLHYHRLYAYYHLHIYHLLLCIYYLLHIYNYHHFYVYHFFYIYYHLFLYIYHYLHIYQHLLHIHHHLHQNYLLPIVIERHQLVIQYNQHIKKSSGFIIFLKKHCFFNFNIFIRNI